MTPIHEKIVGSRVFCALLCAAAAVAVVLRWALS